MHLSSVQMMSETAGWAVGVERKQVEGMIQETATSILSTTDGGSRWKTVATYHNPSIFPASSFFLSQMTAWVAHESHLSHTSDAGASWHTYDLPLA